MDRRRRRCVEEDRKKSPVTMEVVWGWCSMGEDCEMPWRWVVGGLAMRWCGGEVVWVSGDEGEERESE